MGSLTAGILAGKKKYVKNIYLQIIEIFLLIKIYYQATIINICQNL